MYSTLSNNRISCLAGFVLQHLQRAYNRHPSPNSGSRAKRLGSFKLSCCRDGENFESGVEGISRVFPLIPNICFATSSLSTVVDNGKRERPDSLRYSHADSRLLSLDPFWGWGWGVGETSSAVGRRKFEPISEPCSSPIDNTADDDASTFIVSPR